MLEKLKTQHFFIILLNIIVIIFSGFSVSALHQAGKWNILFALGYYNKDLSKQAIRYL